MPESDTRKLQGHKHLLERAKCLTFRPFSLVSCRSSRFGTTPVALFDAKRSAGGCGWHRSAPLQPVRAGGGMAEGFEKW